VRTLNCQLVSGPVDRCRELNALTVSVVRSTYHFGSQLASAILCRTDHADAQHAATEYTNTKYTNTKYTEAEHTCPQYS